MLHTHELASQYWLESVAARGTVGLCHNLLTTEKVKGLG